MSTKKSALVSSNQAKEPETVEYQVDKMLFVVTPVYREDSGKTIYDILFDWIKRDIENH